MPLKKTKFEKIELENGLRVVLAPEEHGLATTILVLVAAGSHYETKEKSGISHFLEHMCFKGTKKYPRAMDISSAFESLGAEYNAFTGSEYTGYYAKAESRHAMEIMDLLSDMYLSPAFDEAEIEKEKGVIAEEINLYADLPERDVQEVFTELLYGDTPAGWKVLGNKKSVSRIKRKDFLDYRAANYLASSTVIVVAGKFKKPEILKGIKEYFGKVKNGRKTPIVKTKDSQTKPALVLKFKKTDQAHLVIGVRAFDYFDKRRYVLRVLSGVLGGGGSSRLFQKIREEMGLAYYIYASPSLYCDHGFMAAYAGVKNRELQTAISVILEEFKKLKTELISAEELKRTKDRIIGNIVLGLETSDEVAGFYGDQEICEKSLHAPEEIIKDIESVSAAEVQALASELFCKENLNLAIIGPHRGKKRFERLLKI